MSWTACCLFLCSLHRWHQTVWKPWLETNLTWEGSPLCEEDKWASMYPEDTPPLFLFSWNCWITNSGHLVFCICFKRNSSHPYTLCFDSKKSTAVLRCFWVCSSSEECQEVRMTQLRKLSGDINHYWRWWKFCWKTSCTATVLITQLLRVRMFSRCIGLLLEIKTC